jgi:hypothetical protein
VGADAHNASTLGGFLSGTRVSVRRKRSQPALLPQRRHGAQPRTSCTGPCTCGIYGDASGGGATPVAAATGHTGVYLYE